mgnify:CR=1 FL=1
MAAIILLVLGALTLYFAVEIGVRRRSAFLHEYHYQNMKEEDIASYLHLMGVGLAVVGICFVSSAMILSCQMVLFLPVLFGGLLPESELCSMPGIVITEVSSADDTYK